MTIKEKKEFLSSYKLINSEINRLLSERERYYALATKITTTYSDIPITHSNISKVESAIEKITVLENKMNEKIDELTQQKEKIEKAISTVNDKTLEEILKRKYINCQTWEEIAVDMNYSKRQIIRLHREVLKKMSPNVTL